MFFKMQLVLSFAYINLRSVYLNITGAYEGHVDLNVYDLEMLFQVRRENGWTGIDSLYHSWLFVNFRRTPSGFSVRKFSATYPDWREKMMSHMDLRPATDTDACSDSDVEEVNANIQKQPNQSPIQGNLVPAATSSPIQRKRLECSTSTGKRSLDATDDMIIVEDLLQMLIAKVARAPIKSEFDRPTDNEIIILSDDDDL